MSKLRTLGIVAAASAVVATLTVAPATTATARTGNSHVRVMGKANCNAGHPISATQVRIVARDGETKTSSVNRRTGSYSMDFNKIPRGGTSATAYVTCQRGGKNWQRSIRITRPASRASDDLTINLTR
jgi:hypothetical protein